MKIFNWVHRKFHHKELDRDVKKAEYIDNEYADTQALLEHVTLGGVLTIGTFGFDPLTDFNQQKNYYVPEEEYEGYEEEEEEYDEENFDDYECKYSTDDEEGELDPLVFKAFRDDSLKEIGSHCDENNDEFFLSPSPNDLGFEPSKSECDKNKKNGERVTLADLFSADSENVTKKDDGNVKQDSFKKSGSRSKNPLSFAKKLIPRVKEDSHPIQKLQQLMTRMMKRKIHPDFEGKSTTTTTTTSPQKNKEIQIMPNLLIMPHLKTTQHHGPANESLSLLQTQDVIACA